MLPKRYRIPRQQTINQSQGKNGMFHAQVQGFAEINGNAQQFHAGIVSGLLCSIQSLIGHYVTINWVCERDNSHDT
jgi:hypothetical protein